MKKTKKNRQHYEISKKICKYKTHTSISNILTEYLKLKPKNCICINSYVFSHLGRHQIKVDKDESLEPDTESVRGEKKSKILTSSSFEEFWNRDGDNWVRKKEEYSSDSDQ